MAEPSKSQPGGLDKQSMKQILVPALAVAGIILLVGLVIYVSGAAGAPKMPHDGSNGGVDDPDLKELTPGVKYRDLKAGVGDECPAGAEVVMHYVGWLPDGTVFDSSRDKGQPATFQLANLIPGWQEGVPGMKPGGIRKLVISPEKGYGARGSPPKIPGNSTLIFEIELKEFKGGTPAVETRPRRTPPPSDLSKLSDGSDPKADDPDLKELGGGLKYRDLKVGDGPECPRGATVTMDYIGWRKADGNLFDASWNPGREPLTSPLGGLIAGWQQGVPGMKVGGIRKLVIPADMAYGENPGGGRPGGVLVFEIELLGFR